MLDCGHDEGPGKPVTTIDDNGQKKVVRGWTSTTSLDGKRNICYSCKAKEILDCGHPVGKHDILTTGYGIVHGKRLCFDCCADHERAEMSKTGRGMLYLSTSGGTGTVSNWPGTLKVPCGVRRGRHNIAGTRYDVWFKLDGRDWHGVQYGENTQICHCKRLKA